MARVNLTKRMQVKLKGEMKKKRTIIQEKEEETKRETRASKKQKLEKTTLVEEELKVMQDPDVVFPLELLPHNILTTEGIDQPMVLQFFNAEAIRALLSEELTQLKPNAAPGNTEALNALSRAKEQILGGVEDAVFKHFLEAKQELFWVYKHVDKIAGNWKYTAEHVEKAVAEAKVMMSPAKQDEIALRRILYGDNEPVTGADEIPDIEF
jgi:hypothetical protein